MAYLSLYRKWRPQSFSDVVGQTYVVKTLENSLKTGRINHAYLFTGPRGTGKTTLARLLAKGLNCENGPTAEICGTCGNCQAISEGRALNVMEIDGASNRGIEEVRELREQARYAPTEGRYKVYIIDEVHMLTPEAFNALLKTLEEPPEHVIFMFATTDPHKIPATILSRCQRYDLKRFPLQEIQVRLRQVLDGEGAEAEDAALAIIARHAEGGMRDALGILDQCLAYADTLTVDVIVDVLGAVPDDVLATFGQALLDGNSSQALTVIDQLHEDGKDILQFTRSFVHYLRSQLLVKEPMMPLPRLFEAVELFAQCEKEMRYAFDAKLPLELAVLKYTDLPNAWQDMAGKIAALEEEVKELKARGSIIGAASTAAVEAGAAEQRPLMVGDDSKQLQQLAGGWEDFLLALRGERLVQSEAFLREGTPVALQGSLVTLAFPKERGFHKASIEQEKHRIPAERVLSKFFGRTLEIQCVTGKSEDFRSAENDDVNRSSSELRSPDISSSGSLKHAAVEIAPNAGSAANAEQECEPKQPQSSESLPEREDTKQKPDNPEQWDDTVQAALKAFGGKVVRVEDSQKGGS